MKEITIAEKEKCFLCGRTSKDFHIIKAKAFEKLDLDIEKLLRDKENESTRLDELKQIGLTIDENHKELLIDSVTAKLNSYEKIIPGIEKIAQFYRREFGSNPKRLKIRDVLIYLNTNGSKEMKRITGILENQNKYKEDFEEGASFLEQRKMQIQPNTDIPGDFRINYEISLCIVCNQLIKNLEKRVDALR